MRRPLLDAPTVGARGGVMGRPRLNPPEDAAKIIEEAAADGFSVVGVAARLGTTNEMLRRWLREREDLREALAAGRERERHALHNRLYRIAMEEDGKTAVLAAMYLLNTRHGYREAEQTDGGRVNIYNINLPAARPINDFIEADDVERTHDHRLPATRS